MQDWICPPEQSYEIKRSIELGGGPGVELHVIKGANHSVQHEKTAEVLGLIRGFLAV